MALSDAQMAALTSNIVWLVSQTVTLPDGTQQTVLVPQVYLAKNMDLSPTGALIAGDSVGIKGRDIVNTGGTISGKQQLLLAADHDISNIGGALSGGNIGLFAGNNILDQSVTNTTINNFGNSSSVITAVGAVGKIAATQNLIMSAGQNLNLQGAQISAGGNAMLSAGNAINVETVATGSRQVSQTSNTYTEMQGTHAVGSTVAAGGNLGLVSKGDLTVTGSNLSSGKDMLVAAGGNVTIQNATDSSSYHTEGSGSGNGKKGSQVVDRNNQTAVGSSLSAGGNVTVLAGAQQDAFGNVVLVKDAPAKDLTLTASAITAGTNLDGLGNAALGATGNVTIGEASLHNDFFQEDKSSHKGFMSSGSNHDMTTFKADNAQGSTVSGNQVSVTAGNDVTVRGSGIAATKDLSIGAGNNVNIVTTQNTVQNTELHEEKKSGLMGSGGIGFTIGNRSKNGTQTSSSVTNNGSTVGSIDGNVNITAGNTYNQSGSDVIAMQGDVGVTAQKINVTAVHDTYTGTQTSSFSQSGLTLGVTAPVINAVQGVQQMASASGKTDDARMKVLARAAAAGSAYSAVGAVQNPAQGVTISLTVGSSSSNSESTQSSSTVVGSTVKAGGNVTMTASGAGKDSNLNVIGSDVVAGQSAILKADGDINLGAAQSTDTQHSTSSSSSAAIGIAATYGSKGFAAGITANAAGSRGNSDGSDVTNVNSHVSAGNTLVLSSGHDTNLKGAVASGNQVFANVGTSGQGNLNIESLQDTSTYKSKDQAIGGSITVGVGVSGSANYSQSKVDGNYASVGEQSGIKAGDGGFIVNVNGNTDLKGGVIASSDTAVKNNANVLATQTLTQSDIENHSSYSASGMSVGGGYGQQNDKTPGGKSNAGPTGTSVGYSSASGDSHGTSRSGVSGGTMVISDDQKQQQLTGKTATEAVAAVNHDVGVSSAGSVTKDWDGQKLNSQVTAETQIVAAFGQQAAMAIGTYADKQQKALNAEAVQAEDRGDTEQAASLRAQAAKWGESGDYRVALHTGIGALTGGAAGAAGAFVSAEAMSTIGAAIDHMGLPDVVAKGLAQVTATALGAVVGGGAGAASSLNVEANNRQLHPDERTLAKQLAANSNGKYTVEQVEDAMRAAGNKRLGEGVGAGSIVNVDGNTATVYDDGAKWSVVQNGQNGTQLMQQVPLNVSPDLMAYIQQNTGNTYAWSPTQNLSLNMNNASGVLNPYKQANCIGTQCSVVMINPPLPTKDQMADGAGWLSTQSGRFAAAATAYGTFLANSPNPILQAGAATQLSMAWTATLVGFGASATEQLLRPNYKGFGFDSTVDLANFYMSDKFPLLGPATTEIGENLKGSNWAKPLKNGGGK
jgi:filamentous hemagglutinin